MKTLTIYGAHGCCLCDEAMQVLKPLASELGIALEYVSIDGDESLEAQWRTSIPVGLLDGRKVFKYHVDEAMLRRRVGQTRGE